MQEHSIEALNLLDDQALKALDWKNLTCLNGRLLELHAEGQLGNEEFAKLPRKPILALSSGQCNLHQSLDFQAGKKITYAMTRKKWMVNKATGTGTAIFEGAILDAEGNMILETKKVIVGILLPKEIQALREKHGGLLGVKTGADASTLSGLLIPVHDEGPCCSW